jgi:hypothetical protein
MDNRMHELEDQAARFLAEQTARLLRDLDRIEDRIAVIEAIIQATLPRPTLN